MYTFSLLVSKMLVNHIIFVGVHQMKEWGGTISERRGWTSLFPTPSMTTTRPLCCSSPLFVEKIFHFRRIIGSGVRKMSKMEPGVGVDGGLDLLNFHRLIKVGHVLFMKEPEANQSFYKEECAIGVVEEDSNVGSPGSSPRRKSGTT